MKTSVQNCFKWTETYCNICSVVRQGHRRCKNAYLYENKLKSPLM